MAGARFRIGDQVRVLTGEGAGSHATVSRLDPSFSSVVCISTRRGMHWTPVRNIELAGGPAVDDDDDAIILAALRPSAASTPSSPSVAEIARYCEWKRNARTCIDLAKLPPAPELMRDHGPPQCPHCFRILRISRPAKLYACVLCERKWDTSRSHFPTAFMPLDEAVKTHPVVPIATAITGVAVTDRTTPPSYEEATLLDTDDDEEEDRPLIKQRKRKAAAAAEMTGKKCTAAANKSQRI